MKWAAVVVAELVIIRMLWFVFDQWMIVARPHRDRRPVAPPDPPADPPPNSPTDIA